MSSRALPEGFLARSLGPHSARANHRRRTKGARPQGPGSRRDRTGRRRARFRHARQYQGGSDRRRSGAVKRNTPPSREFPSCARAISAKFKRENGLDYAPAQCFAAPGGKSVIYHALMATLNPGDEVIMSAPYWVSYPDIVLLADAKPVIVETKHRERLSPDAGCVEPGDHAEDQMADLQSALQSVRRLLYARTSCRARPTCCSIIRMSGFSPTTCMNISSMTGSASPPSPQCEPRLCDRTLTMNGVSKAYAMTGWRIGYCGGPEPLIKAMAKLQSQTVSNPASISQWASVEALTGPQGFIDGIPPRFPGAPRSRRFDAQPGQGHRMPKARRRLLRLSVDPQADRQTHAKAGNAIATDEDFVSELLEAEGVAVVHGAAFGLSPFFRISYAASNAASRKPAAASSAFAQASPEFQGRGLLPAHRRGASIRWVMSEASLDKTAPVASPNIGRGKEADMSEKNGGSGPRAVALVGPYGSGKTTLAGKHSRASPARSSARDRCRKATRSATPRPKRARGR